MARSGPGLWARLRALTSPGRHPVPSLGGGEGREEEMGGGKGKRSRAEGPVLSLGGGGEKGKGGEIKKFKMGRKKVAKKQS